MKEEKKKMEEERRKMGDVVRELEGKLGDVMARRVFWEGRAFRDMGVGALVQYRKELEKY